LLQRPQFSVSVCVSVHRPLHIICVPVQPPPVHMLLAQLCSALQAKLQAPQ